MAVVAVGAVAAIVLAFLALPRAATKLEPTQGDWEYEEDIGKEDIRPNAPSIFMETSDPGGGAR